MSRRSLLTLDEVVANLRSMRASALPAQIAEGRAWYPAMGSMICGVRDEATEITGERASDPQAVGIFAAFSQNATWKANVTMATKYLRGGTGGMKSVLAECAAMEDGADPTSAGTLGLKRAAFCANLLGDMSRVTCDRWHLRAAFDADRYDASDLSDAPRQIGRTREKYKPAKAAKLGRTHSEWLISINLTEAVFTMVTAATVLVADEYRETPAACQAIIWCAVRGDGQ